MPTIEEFGQTIKQKYPQYQNIDDKELGTKMLEKYPEYKSKVFDTDPKTQESISKPTEGVVDALKKGWENIKTEIKSSGEELSNVLSTPAKSPFVPVVKTATTLIKGVINPLAETAIATPARMIGEGIQSATGYDINEAVSQGTQRLVKKGLETETAKKAMEGWASLKETNPEAAMALSSILDIADIASNVVGLGAESRAIETAVKTGLKGALKTGEKVVSAGAKAGEKIVGNVAPSLEKAGQFGISQTFGLKPETIKNIIKNPELFTQEEMSKITRESVFNKVKTAVDSRLNDLSETGKGYDKIRNIEKDIIFKEDPVKNVLKSFGLDLGEDGKIISTVESTPLSNSDISAIENFYKQFGGQQTLSPNALLNARKALDNLSAFESGKTDAPKRIARAIRSEYDKIAKSELPGLSELDAKYSSEKQLLEKVKSSIFDKKGDIKPNAISTISNLTGQGKEQLLAKIEKIVPGITEDVNILKSIQDIASAESNKVGTYTRSVLGVGTGALAGGPVGAIMGMIMTSPQMGIKILRTYAKYKNIPNSFLNKTIEKMKSGARLIGKEKKIIDEAVNDAAKKVQERAKKLKK